MRFPGSQYLLYGLFLTILPLNGQDCVTVTGAVLDEHGAPVADAALRFAPENSSPPAERISASDGTFSACLSVTGWQQITVTHPAYLQLRERLLIERSGTHLDLHLNAKVDVYQSVDVHEEAVNLQPTSNTVQNSLGNKEAINIPFQGRDLWPMLGLLPGVIQDPLGRMHLGGSQINQVQCRLDSFTITNPINGQCDIHLDTNSVETLSYATGQYSTEFGKGSAGLLAINTRMGTDVFHYSVTNFVPGVDFHSGVHSGSFAPRFELSGPVVKHRVWFFESAGVEYLPVLVEDLPKNNQTSSLRLFNHLRTQANLSPTSVLHVAFLANSYNAPRFGLSVLDPFSTTVDHRNRTWFTSIKQTKFLKNGATLEAGYAEFRTFARQIPQGDGALLFTPFGEQGNYFVDLKQLSTRRQAIVNFSARKYKFLGVHQFRTGLDSDRSSYWQNVQRSGYEHVGLDGTLLNLTTFGGNGLFGRSSTDAAIYVEDNWSLKPQFLLTLGARADWDQLLHRTAFSPRVGAAYYLESLGVRLSAGFAVTRDADFLPLFVQAYDQYSITTNYNPDGSLAGPPRLTLNGLSPTPLKYPIYENYTVGVERMLFHNVALKSTLMSRRGYNGLTYVVSPEASTLTNTVLSLQNYRRDVYDSAEFVVRQPLGKDHEWQASYTRSRALSNAVVNLAVDTPVGIPLNVGPMPWDSPNRLLFWGYFPSPWETWSFATLVEARNGFPFSVEDPSGITVGAIDSRRYPAYFDLDLHIEHTLRIGSHRVAIRAGVTNLTDHMNATVVNDMVGSPQFLQFYGSRGRHFLFRLRWLESKK